MGCSGSKPDPATGAVRGHDLTDVTAVPHAADKFSGVAALGGKLYAAPFEADKLLEFDPATGAVRGHDVTAVTRAAYKFNGVATLGGKLYAAPLEADKLLEFDPATGAVAPECDDFDTSQPIILQTTDVVNDYKDALDGEVRLAEEQVRAAEEQVRAAEAQLVRQKAALQDLRCERLKREELVKLRRAIDRGECCQFYFVDADMIRKDTSSNSSGWTFRDLKQKGLVKLMTISLRSAFSGELVEEFLSVSHRWDSPDIADPSGKQYAAIRDYVLKNPKVQHIWMDCWCLPQGERTGKDQALFKATLPHINLVYLTTSVLLLLDLSYLSRFWTQFEAWLSFQTCTSQGLTHASDQQRRATTMRLHNAPPGFEDTLYGMWANKTPAQAHEILSKPDVTVTNSSDKVVQLKKIATLDKLVRTVATATETVL